jgi:predicted nucleic acid-binding protein
LKPAKHLPYSIYERELSTHRKCRAIMSLLKKESYLVYFPRAGLVEVASALRRNDVYRDTIREILDAIEKTFIIINEDALFDKALEVALAEAPSGFDAYFIAPALKVEALLLTDDEPMAIHAENLGVETILVRMLSEEEILKKLNR